MERFKITPAVYLVLIRNNSILLLRRFNTGLHDGEYDFPAGHVDSGETFSEAVFREVKEEVGIDIEPKDLELIHVIHKKQSDQKRIEIYFRINNWKSEPKIMEPNKCDDLKWFSLDELPKNFMPHSRQALKCILGGIIYSEFGW